LFRISLEWILTDDYKILVTADKTPIGQHVRQYNFLMIDDVTIVLVGEEFDLREIIFHHRNGNFHWVSETHRSYDGLQCPILFYKGKDWYNFNIKLRNSKTYKKTNKKVSAMNYY